MKYAREVAIVIVWFLLLYRVVTLILDDEYANQYVILLALFAWLGGLVTNELIRILAAIWRNRYRGRE